VRDKDIENICAFAACVAYADGDLSHDEVIEIMENKGYLPYILQLGPAIHAFEATKDLNDALKLKPVTAKIGVELWGKVPSYIAEVYESIDRAAKSDDFESVAEIQKAFARQIEDPLQQRVAAWLAFNVAAIDGLSVFEKLFLEGVCREVFGFDCLENMKWFDEVVFPLISGEQRESEGTHREIDLESPRDMAEQMIGEVTNELETRLAEIGISNPKQLLDDLLSTPDIKNSSGHAD